MQIMFTDRNEKKTEEWVCLFKIKNQQKKKYLSLKAVNVLPWVFMFACCCFVVGLV